MKQKVPTAICVLKFLVFWVWGLAIVLKDFFLSTVIKKKEVVKTSKLC